MQGLTPEGRATFSQSMTCQFSELSTPQTDLTILDVTDGLLLPCIVSSLWSYALERSSFYDWYSDLNWDVAVWCHRLRIFSFSHGCSHWECLLLLASTV